MTPDTLQHTGLRTVPPPSPLPPLARDEFDVGATPDSLQRLAACAREHGDLFRIHAPGRRSDTWIVNDPADIKRVLVTNHRNYTKGIGLDRVAILLGNGIMTSEGDTWRRQRRMVQPMFHRRVVERHARSIDGCIDARLAAWQHHATRGETLDVCAETSELTLDVVLRSIFGDDLEWLAERTGANPFAIVTAEPERNLLFAYRFRSLARVIGELVARRRAEAAEHDDFLGMLMHARDRDTGAPMGDRELLDEVMTLIVAGHETTAAALSFVWYLLARHPEAETRLHAELDAVPERRGLAYAETESLRYTRAVIQEAMRLYPPGWVLTRRTLDADELSGFAIPAGTDLMISPYLIGRHPRHWEAPDAFRPERFLDDDPRERWIYVPFAAGPRHCVGENFAMYEMVVHVSRVARRWRLALVDDGPLALEAAINLRPRQGLPMQLLPRP